MFDQKAVKPEQTKEDQIPCQYTRNINDYMNRADVKKALKVNSEIIWKESNLGLN